MLIENFTKTESENAILHSPLTQLDKSRLYTAIGNCLSYNESAINKHVIKSTNLSKSIVLDKERMTVKVSSGVTIQELINYLRDDGLFPYVVPGTSMITIGGAVSNNVHGKNQLTDGLFCDHVEEIEIIDSNQNSHLIDRDNPIFHAICGGIGTLGYIKTVTMKVKKLPSDFYIVKKVISKNLEDTIKHLDKNDDSVAWVDMSAKKSKLGRGVIFSSTFSSEKKRAKMETTKIKIPNIVKLPLINPITSFIFCKLKYTKEQLTNLIFNKYKKQHFSKYLFPLDAIDGWNNLYGRKGFYQFQALIPNEKAKDTFEQLILHFQSHSLFSPIVVIKRMKKTNIGHLSFSGNGYTICFDLPRHNPLSDKRTSDIIKEAHQLVVETGGLIYLAKDRLMDECTFSLMYKNSDKQKDAISEFNNAKTIFTKQALRYGL